MVTDDALRKHRISQDKAPPTFTVLVSADGSRFLGLGINHHMSMISRIVAPKSLIDVRTLTSDSVRGTVEPVFAYPMV
jgi:hypothetical protein